MKRASTSTFADRIYNVLHEDAQGLCRVASATSDFLIALASDQTRGRANRETRIQGWNALDGPALYLDGPGAWALIVPQAVCDAIEYGERVPFVDVDKVTEYGLTQRLSAAVRCF